MGTHILSRKLFGNIKPIEDAAAERILGFLIGDE